MGCISFLGGGDGGDVMNDDGSIVVIALEKLQSVADAAPRDVVLVVDDCRVPANRMLLSLCSDFFAAMFQGSFAEKASDEVRLCDVTEDEMRSVVAYSEGRCVPAIPDVDRFLRVQDRFLMPALLRHCERVLRAHVSIETWHDVACIACGYGLWDLLADVSVWASRLSWRVAADTVRHAEAIWGARPAAPECVARILRNADFACVAQKVWVAARWLRAAVASGECEGPEDPRAAQVFDAIRDDITPPDACSMWPAEAQMALADCAGIEPLLPRRLLVDIVLGVSTPLNRRRLPQHQGGVMSEHRRAMAKVDASMSGVMGAGTYQAVLLPATASTHCLLANAYFSEEVRLTGPSAQYHVYLDEDERLSAWWREHGVGSSGLLMLIRYRGC